MVAIGFFCLSERGAQFAEVAAATLIIALPLLLGFFMMTFKLLAVIQPYILQK